MVIKGGHLILSSYSLYCRIHPWIRQQEVLHDGFLAKNELFDGYNVYPNIKFYRFFLHVNFTSIDAGMTTPTQRCCSHTYHPFSCNFRKTPEGRIVKIKKKINTGKKNTQQKPPIVKLLITYSRSPQQPVNLIYLNAISSSPAFALLR